MSDRRQKVTSLPGLLLVDDDALIVDSLSFVLEDDFQIATADSRQSTKQLLQALNTVPSLALVDLGLPPLPHAPDEGFALISELLAFNPEMKILVLSGQNKKSNIQHALTLGAVDFIPKPCDAELLKSRLQHQLMMLDAEQQQVDTQQVTGGLLGESAAMQTLRGQIAQFADTPFPVLIEGESGSGKELVAQCLHQQSEKASLPFLTINCATFTADLLEAQLFGHSKGAFTGADKARAGFFEEAGRGSLVLDEIGELPLELQAKLLRVLENGEFYRLGETQARSSQCRVITATNRDLREEVRTGRFRSDLYHRLSVLTIRVPPLRERGEDCLLLLAHFRKVYSASLTPFSLDKSVESILQEYSFPGNVRELRNIVIRLAAKYPGTSVGVDELYAELETSVTTIEASQGTGNDANIEQQLLQKGFRLDQQLDEWERAYITAALKLAGGNLSKAARLLGVNRTTLYSKIERLSMDLLE